MRKVIASIYFSLDGALKKPAWTMPYWNDEAGAFAHKQLFAHDAPRLGRVTYQGFAAAGPSLTHTGDFGEWMNAMPTLVASTTLTDMAWNAPLLQGAVATAVAERKQQPDQNLRVYGSGDLAETLRRHNLTDEYRLWVHPVVVGSSRRLFLNAYRRKTCLA